MGGKWQTKQNQSRPVVKLERSRCYPDHDGRVHVTHTSHDNTDQTYLVKVAVWAPDTDGSLLRRSLTQLIQRKAGHVSVTG